MNSLRKFAAHALASAARFMARGYDGAQEHYGRGRLDWDRAANQDEDRYATGPTRDLLRQTLMNHRRNEPVTKGLCDRMCDFVVGPHGLQVQAQTSDPGFNSEAEDWFRDWQRGCSVNGRTPFRKVQRMHVDARLWAGESFTLFSDGIKIQGIESERIRQPHGVIETASQYDGIRLRGPEVAAWWVADRDDNGTFSDPKRGRWIDAASLYQFGSTWRFDNIRPLPELAAGLSVSTDVGEIELFTLMQMKRQAQVAGVTNTADGSDMFTTRKSPGQTGTAGGMRAEKVDGAGLIIRGLQGESFTPMAPATPNPNLEGHLVFNLRKFCACAGIPYEVALMDSTRGNLSQNKAVRELFARVVETWQLDLADYVRFVWAWAIPQAWARGDIRRAPVKNGRSEWDRVAIQLPPATWADPQDAADTDSKNLVMGNDSHSGVIARRGGDILEVWTQRAKDEQLRMKLAKEYGINPDAISKVAVPGAQNGTAQAAPEAGKTP